MNLFPPPEDLKNDLRALDIDENRAMVELLSFHGSYIMKKPKVKALGLLHLADVPHGMAGNIEESHIKDLKSLIGKTLPGLSNEAVERLVTWVTTEAP